MPAEQKMLFFLRVLRELRGAKFDMTLLREVNG